MPPNEPNAKPDPDHGRSEADVDPPEPKPKWGPIMMAEELASNAFFAKRVRRALRKIADGGADAEDGKNYLNKYYATEGNEGEMRLLGIKPADQAALYPCTDRNNLILYAAFRAGLIAD